MSISWENVDDGCWVTRTIKDALILPYRFPRRVRLRVGQHDALLAMPAAARRTCKYNPQIKGPILLRVIIFMMIE